MRETCQPWEPSQESQFWRVEKCGFNMKSDVEMINTQFRYNPHSGLCRKSEGTSQRECSYVSSMLLLHEQGCLSLKQDYLSLKMNGFIRNPWPLGILFIHIVKIGMKRFCDQFWSVTSSSALKESSSSAQNYVSNSPSGIILCLVIFFHTQTCYTYL